MANNDELEEIWQLFIVEGEESLNNTEDALEKLSEDSSNAEVISSLFRYVHTFKGMANMMGLANIESVAHRSEDLIGLIRDHGVELDKDLFYLLLRALDKMRSNFEHASESRSDIDADSNAEVLAELNEMYTLKSSGGGDSHATNETEQTQSECESEVPAREEENECLGEQEQPVDAESEMYVEAESDDFGEDCSVTAEDKKALETAAHDPATDPVYVKIFLELAETELGSLRSELNKLAEGDLEAVTRALNIIDNVHHAASNMGYQRLIDVLNQYCDVLKSYDPTNQDCKANLAEYEIHIQEELALIQHVLPESEQQSTHVQGASVSSVFANTFSEHIKKDLLKLESEIEGLLSEIDTMLSKGSDLQGRNSRLEKIIEQLRSIYQSCVFYNIDAAAQLTLIIQDLYSRIVQDEMSANKELIKLTKEYVCELEGLFSAVCMGKEVNLDAVKDMIARAHNVFSQTHTGQASDIARKVLDLLDIEQKFIELITSENIIALSQAFNDGDNVYTIFANLEDDESVGMRFYEWSSSEEIMVITNITEYVDNKTYFNFLVTSYLDEDEFREEIQRLDPSGALVKYSPCTLKMPDECDFKTGEADAVGMQIVSSIEPEVIAEIPPKNDIDIMEAVGQLVTTQAGLQHLIHDIEQSEFGDVAAEIIEEAGNDPSRLKMMISSHLERQNDALYSRLLQLSNEFTHTLAHFREAALQLREMPVSIISKPLAQFVLELAHHGDKNVRLKVLGDDLVFDQELLNIVSEPLRSIVWFIMGNCIETTEERRSQGKSDIGSMTISFEQTGEHLRVTIDNDGAGFNTELIANKSHALGLTISDPYEALLHHDFGKFSNKPGNDDVGVDFAQIASDFKHQSGRLRIQEVDDNIQIVLSLPLTSMVIDGMVIRVGKVNYVVPIISIRRILQPSESNLTRISSEGGKFVLRVGDELIPMTYLGNESFENKEGIVIMIVEGDVNTAAFSVDELIGQQQVLIQPLSGYLADIPFMSGCALLGGGEVGMVLDINSLCEYMGSRHHT